MTENPEERVPLPSLVADDLVDLVRDSLAPNNPFGPRRITVPFLHEGEGERFWPTVRTDGRPVALEYAILELVVEIRDFLRDQAARLGHVHLDQPPAKTADGLAVRLGDLEVLEDRIAVELGKHYLGGRLPGVQSGVLDVLARWLRENGLLA